jgi:uncharacterized membrane protein
MRSKKLINWLIVIFIILSFLGFSDALFLTISHYTIKTVPCVISSFDCNKVISGPYSTILGVPIALLGVGYYLVLFIIMVAYLDRNQNGMNYRYRKILLLASRLTIIGLIVSLWLIFLMAFIIKAFCLFCLISALISIILFVLGLFILKKSQQE